MCEAHDAHEGCHECCKPCVRRVIKWGAIIYVGHWVLHGIAFLISPALGAWLLLLL